MNRLLMIGSLAALLVGTTGCLHHNLRGGCSTGGCETGGCETGGCSSGSCGGGCGIMGKLGCSGDCNGDCNGDCGGKCGCMGSKVLSRLGGICGMCGGKGGCRTGCVAGALGWQQGGLDYSSHLQPGILGHDAPSALRSQAQYGQGGLPSAQVGYPYYTVRGPRDFLMENPPTIGR